MNLPEIERSISQAVENRPKVTAAAMNLYFYNGSVICGARAVMPEGADFIAHVPPDRLENGFDEKEWKVIVEKTFQVMNSRPQTRTAVNEVLKVKSKSQYEITEDNSKLEERRKEQRLAYRKQIWFSKELNGTFKQGQMLDVSSGGMAFTCFLDGDRSFTNGEIVTKFEVPRYNESGLADMVSFNRIGRICRVNQVNSSLHSIAIEFCKPLSFKPGHQKPVTNSADQILTKTDYSKFISL